MPDPIWLPVVGHPGYIVSDHGQVRSPRRALPGYAKPPYGYIMVSLGLPKKNRPIHQLVLEAFVGPRPPGQQGRHLDGNTANNRLTNLDWGTPKKNSQDRITHGTQNHGEAFHSNVLTEKQVLEIVELLNMGLTQTEIALEYGVSMGAISGIKSGKNWSWLTGIPKPEWRK